MRVSSITSRCAWLPPTTWAFGCDVDEPMQGAGGVTAGEGCEALEELETGCFDGAAIGARRSRSG